MQFDFSKLSGRIVEKFGTRGNFAAAVGIGESSLSEKLNNKRAMDSNEIMEWSAPGLLDIPPEKLHIYFLTPKVR